MKIQGIKTHRVRVGEVGVEKFVDKYITAVEEGSVIVFSSKVIAILEGRVEPFSANKGELIKRESDLHLDKEISKYGNTFTINKNTLISASGIDESNADGHYILWPNDPMASAQRIRAQLVDRFGVKKLGVIICDSTVMPLRRGTIGIMIGWSGFKAVKELVGTKDLFGREFKISAVAVGSSLAAAGNAVMGEGTEQTPIAVITDVPFVEFGHQKYEEAFINMEDDLFAPFLLSQKWKK